MVKNKNSDKPCKVIEIDFYVCKFVRVCKSIREIGLILMFRILLFFLWELLVHIRMLKLQMLD